MLNEQSQTTPHQSRPQSPHQSPHQSPRATRRAFTLVELIIVILIIAVVVAITLPALGMANQAAKKAKSQMLAANLGAAIAAFQSDNNRLPGYFSAAEMGAAANTTRGFTTLENAMLDLMGGIVPANSTGTLLQVGPDNNNTVFVNLDLIGSNTNANASYFNPEKKAYIAQDGLTGGLQASNQPDIQALPDLVDAFGTPVLLWIENPATKNTIVQSPNNTTGIPFARVDSGSSMNQPARFYWAANAGFLNSTQLGTIGRSQVRQGGDDRFSLIGGALPPTSLEQSLMGLLGSPTNANIDLAGVAPQDIVPTDARGGFTIQLAGPDGIYVSSTDKGAARFSNDVITYWSTWFVNSSTRVTNENGQPASEDLIIDSFDDFLLTGAN